MRFIWSFTAVILFHSDFGFAYVAGQLRPGVIELRSEGTGGLQIQNVAFRSRGQKKWLYFCVSGQSSRKKQRCFYAKSGKYPGLKAGFSLERIEYELSPRIHNKNGVIAIGQQRYFYPVRRLGARVP